MPAWRTPGGGCRARKYGRACDLGAAGQWLSSSDPGLMFCRVRTVQRAVFWVLWRSCSVVACPRTLNCWCCATRMRSCAVRSTGSDTSRSTGSGSPRSRRLIRVGDGLRYFRSARRRCWPGPPAGYPQTGPTNQPGLERGCWCACGGQGHQHPRCEASIGQHQVVGARSWRSGSPVFARGRSGARWLTGQLWCQVSEKAPELEIEETVAFVVLPLAMVMGSGLWPAIDAPLALAAVKLMVP